MKKITFIASGLLLSLSVLATQITTPAFNNGTLKQKQIETNFVKTHDVTNVKSQMSHANDFAKIDVKKSETDLTVLRKDVNRQTTQSRVNRVPQNVTETQTTITAKEVGAGMAEFSIEFGDNSANKYYGFYILDEEYKTLAFVGYYPYSTVVAPYLDDFSLSSKIISLARSYGYLDNSLQYTNFLPVGTYIFLIEGYPLTADGQYIDSDSEDNDIAYAGFDITLTGEEYAVKNTKVTINEDKTVTFTWQNVSDNIPEGAIYQVRVFDMPANNTVVSSEDLANTATTWTTTEALNDDSSYEALIILFSEDGYSLSNYDDVFFTIGTDANAPTNLSVITDEETMKATFRWSSVLTTYNGETVYNQVVIRDEEGNEFVFDNGYSNTSGQTATSEPLHVGKYRWQVVPFYVTDAWYYIGVAEGSEFEITDGAAPVIQKVSSNLVTATEVYLKIDITDNNLYITPADMTYTVTGDVDLQNARLEENGTLKISGLTAEQSYKVQITVTDPSGNVSEPYDFEFTPAADDEAPTNLKAEIEEGNVFDRYVIITVSAEDNATPADQLKYIITFADEKVVELNAVDSMLKLEGLTPETEYEITVQVKDLGGNLCEESVSLKFTTTPLIPIYISYNSIQGQYYSQYGEYQFVMFNTDEAENYSDDMLFLLFWPESETKIANIYKPDGTEFALAGIYYMPDDETEIEITTDQVEIKYLTYDTQDGINIPYYYIYFEGIGDDGNKYIYENINWALLSKDTWQNWITVTDEFVDTDAPELWLYDEEEPASVEGTTVEIMFGASDGPFWFKPYDDPIMTEIEDLVIEVVDANGAVLASKAAGSIVNTPTPDEDGASTFTATLTDLQPNTDYTVYITAVDEVGNEATPLEVNFITEDEGETGLFDVNTVTTAKKVIRDGHLYIIRGNDIYNATGIKVVK